MLETPTKTIIGSCIVLALISLANIAGGGSNIWALLPLLPAVLFGLVTIVFFLAWNVRGN